MKVKIDRGGQVFEVDLSNPIDISISMKPTVDSVRAWYVDPLTITPVKGDGFIGEVAQGGSVNFRDIYFNPHGHGTHTECLGHITETIYNVNDCVKPGFFSALLISIAPDQQGQDKVVLKEQIEEAMGDVRPEALILRTLPNNDSKCSRNYSSTNPTYIEESAAAFIRDVGVQHLLIDTPSVDREEDGGELRAHHAFWNVPDKPRMSASITELIFVPESVFDGQYMLHLSWANFENDACPSRPLLYLVQ